MSDWKSRAKSVSAPSWKDKYKNAEAAQPEQMTILDEASPDISFGDRFVAKNFAQSPEKQMEYLKAQNPNLDVRLMGQDVIVKSPDGNYRKLDPSTLELQDITDLGDTVASGITSTLGTIGGGLLGGMAGPGTAVAGAIAGSGAAGSATEALRQRIGKALGIPQDISASDVVTSGLSNAAGTALLGTGAIPKGTTQGLIRKTWNEGLPKMAQYWTGVTDDVLKAYTNPVTREEINSLAKGGKTQFTDDLVNRIRGALGKEKKAVGQALKSEIDSAGGVVNISKIKDSYKNHIQELETAFREMPNELNASRLDDAKSVYKQLFADAGSAGQEIPDALKASQAFSLQGDLKDFGDLKRTGQGLNARYASNATQGEKALSDEAASAYRVINDELANVTSGSSPVLKKQYSELMDLQNALAPSLRSDQSAYSSFTNLDGKSKVMFKEALENLGQKTGENFKDPMVKLQAADYFGSGSWVPKSIAGTTSTSRTGPAMGLGSAIGGTLGFKLAGPVGAGAGAGIGAAAGGATASPQFLKKIIENTDFLRSGANSLGNVIDQQGVTPLLRETIVQSPWFGM